MRTSLNDIQLIEAYLQKTLSQKEQEAFRLRMQTEKPLRIHVFLQRKLNRLLRLFYNQQRKECIVAYHDELFEHKREFRNKILNLFQQP